MVRAGSFVSRVSNLQLVLSVGQEDSALAHKPVCALAHTDMCTLTHIHICCCLWLKEKPSVKSDTCTKNHAPSCLGEPCLPRLLPSDWSRVRTIRSPGERSITHLNNHKANTEFPGTLAQLKATVYFS